ncbi:PilC family type IV pilus tip adhesin [Neisseria mucosa]|uniref:PilC family type IV pilus tip adhesin n=1 Tax=Neisseria mucosa TaxID=488 RepID=UPI000AB692D6|nr:PilC family type IV pilus tip adhesin [Neisseria mucosa]
MKNNLSRFPGTVRPMIYSIASALALMGAASQAQAQFAKTPLYLQNESQITEQPKIKHNIMFFIDDSASMSELVPGAVDESGNPLNRLQVTQEALKQILDTYKNQFNWGLQTLHNNGGSDSDSFDSDPELMKARVNKLRHKYATPATRRYFEIVSSIVMPQVKYRCQKAYVIMMSDGDANYSSYCGDYNVPIFDYENRRYAYATFENGWRNFNSYSGKDYQAAFEFFGPRQEADRSFQCDWAYNWSYVYDKFWDRGNGLAFFSKKLAENDFKVGGEDEAGKSWDGDPNDFGDYKKQTVQTFTVGFGGDITVDGENYLKRGASKKEWYYQANRSEALVAAFKNITDTIKNDALHSQPIPPLTGGTAPATSSSGIPDLAATIKLNARSWSSQILFDKLNNSDGRREGTVTQPSFGNRKTLINTGSNTYFIDAISDDKVDNAYFGIESSDKNEWKKLLNWTGRVGSNDSAYKPYRDRKPGERDLGDILDGSVAAVGNQEHGRRKYLVAAANDGMVHIFQSTDGNHPYDLKVSYLPSAMERENDASGNPITLAKVLKDIAHADYEKSIENHKYGVNGGFTLRQTPVAEQDSKFQQRVFMFGAMGQGGRGAYALNIGGKENQTTNTGLDAATLSDKVPLFETPKGAANELGYTVGTPQIGRISISRPANNGRVDVSKNIRYAGFLASGYRAEDTADKQNETALYIYEMLGKEVGTGDKRGEDAGKAGNLLKKIKVESGVGGLSTPALLDIDFDGVVDIAYAGDRGGNMYRFDLRGEKPDNWMVTKIFTGSPSKPITSAPAVSRRSANKYVVIFGTGSEIYQNDLVNKDIQSIYGIYEDFTPSEEDLPQNQNVTAASESDLQQQEILPDQEGQEGYIYLTNNQVAKTQKGWRINLREGERVSLKPTMILRTAIVTIRKYTSDGGKTIGKEEAEKDLCMPVSNNKSTVTSTTFLGINADNGGALNKRSARFTPETFTRKLDGFGTQYANGLTQEGIVSFTFIDPNKRTDDPVTVDGDSGGTGTDKELGYGSGTPNNKCFSGKEGDQRSLLLNKGKSLEVKGRICGLQRISWRELFF